jgi:hypothetical protein
MAWPTALTRTSARMRQRSIATAATDADGLPDPEK